MVVIEKKIKASSKELKTLALIAEIDDGDRPSPVVPGWFDIPEDVSEDERWIGAALAPCVRIVAPRAPRPASHAPYRPRRLAAVRRT
ncbi:MAG: hypothetical protein WBL35_08095 [Ornithinibacter sp.]